VPVTQKVRTRLIVRTARAMVFFLGKLGLKIYVQRFTIRLIHTYLNSF